MPTEFTQINPYALPVRLLTFLPNRKAMQNSDIGQGHGN